MKPSEELLPVFSASHSPHKQPKRAVSDDSDSNQRKLRGYYRRLSITHKTLIVFLRYESLSDFSSIYRTVSDISRRLGLPYMTVRNALLRFVNAGHLW